LDKTDAGREKVVSEATYGSLPKSQYSAFTFGLADGGRGLIGAKDGSRTGWLPDRPSPTPASGVRASRVPYVISPFPQLLPSHGLVGRQYYPVGKFSLILTSPYRDTRQGTDRDPYRQAKVRSSLLGFSLIPYTLANTT
jgi:hypothetical protein